MVRNCSCCSDCNLTKVHIRLGYLCLSKSGFPRNLDFYNTFYCTPSIPKCSSVFLTLVRLRPAEHWPSSWKYDSWNRKQQLLRNAPRSCGVKSFLDDESLARKYLNLCLKFLAGQINRIVILGPKNLGGRTIILGQREYILSKSCKNNKTKIVLKNKIKNYYVLFTTLIMVNNVGSV